MPCSTQCSQPVKGARMRARDRARKAAARASAAALGVVGGAQCKTPHCTRASNRLYGASGVSSTPRTRRWPQRGLRGGGDTPRGEVVSLPSYLCLHHVTGVTQYMFARMRGTATTLVDDVCTVGRANAAFLKAFLTSDIHTTWYRIKPYSVVFDVAPLHFIKRQLVARPDCNVVAVRRLEGSGDFSIATALDKATGCGCRGGVRPGDGHAPS